LIATRAARLQALFERVTGVTLGAGGRTLTRSLGYVMGADAVGSAVTFALTAWFVRRLGPGEFGLANLVSGVAQLCTIFMLAGLHVAATRDIAARPAEATATISTTAASVAVLCTILAALLAFAGDVVTDLLRISSPVLGWSLALAAAQSGYHLVYASLSGLRRFADIARYGLLSTLGFTVVVAALLTARAHLTFADFVAAGALRSSFSAVLGLAGLRALLGRPSLARAPQLLAFGGYSTAISVCSFFILGGIDSLMLNAYHGPEAVGLYGAYYVVFNLLTSRVVKAVSDVMVPTAAAHTDRALLRRRVLRVYWRAAWLLWPAAVVLTLLLFQVYGQAYEFNWRLAGLMGANVWLHAMSSVLGDFLVAAGLPGVRSSLHAALATAAVNVGANLVLIPRFGVGGTMMASALAFAVALGLRMALVRRVEA